MTTSPEFLLFVVPETLSDGSRVFNVILDPGTPNARLGPFKLAAVTENDAHALAEGIATLIVEHTNHTAHVHYE